MKSKSRPAMAEHFKYTRHPFSDTHAPALPYLTPADERSLDRMLSLLSHGKSHALCSPSGGGKTTLMRHLTTLLDPHHYQPVWLHYGGFNRSGLLRAIAQRLGVETRGRTVPLLMRLQERLGESSGGGKRTHPVLIVDDAHLVEHESLMDLCSLMAGADGRSIAASIVLIGDETLRQRLRLQRLAPVRGRLTAIFGMEPLSDEQTRALIAHRLEAARAQDGLFDIGAVEMIAAMCHGNRRAIMNAATLLLEEAFLRQERIVNTQTVIGCDLLENPGET